MRKGKGMGRGDHIKTDDSTGMPMPSSSPQRLGPPQEPQVVSMSTGSTPPQENEDDVSIDYTRSLDPAPPSADDINGLRAAPLINQGAVLSSMVQAIANEVEAKNGL